MFFSRDNAFFAGEGEAKCLSSTSFTWFFSSKLPSICYISEVNFDHKIMRCVHNFIFITENRIMCTIFPWNHIILDKKKHKNECLNQFLWKKRLKSDTGESPLIKSRVALHLREKWILIRHIFTWLVMLLNFIHFQEKIGFKSGLESFVLVSPTFDHYRESKKKLHFLSRWMV